MIEHKTPRWISAPQAARYLDVSLASIRRWSDAGEITYYRLPGGQRRFLIADLDAWLEARRQEATR